MSITVENNLKDAKNKEIFEQTAHYIPCKIEEDGPANVDKYFVPYIRNNDQELSASFRGYPLDGTKTCFPDNYKGIIVTEAKRPLGEHSERKFQVAGGFKEFTYWNWDKKPSKNDNLVRAMEWIDISEALHGD